jgi:hypothetical protein
MFVFENLLGPHLENREESARSWLRCIMGNSVDFSKLEGGSAVWAQWRVHSACPFRAELVPVLLLQLEKQPWSLGSDPVMPGQCIPVWATSASTVALNCWPSPPTAWLAFPLHLRFPHCAMRGLQVSVSHTRSLGSIGAGEVFAIPVCYPMQNLPIIVEINSL